MCAMHPNRTLGADLPEKTSTKALERIEGFEPPIDLPVGKKAVPVVIFPPKIKAQRSGLVMAPLCLSPVVRKQLFLPLITLRHNIKWLLRYNSEACSHDAVEISS